ncbi:S1C family serine protease [Candidatus Vampirococcus lugosii]|uniref:Periplasmic serine protease, S1-C subfamily n=1 Tax=Candidatus Vampirococcus lugosii TaxID=2789015 RepID=A0ABS5QQE2_9BACT|nr:trypsin-like peptidase domain-containing protein [Candidatus Vampirococcus lugosii]MBS8122434.1 Periplasmic serine protease, S1-C subfamily [Candidatus Vampirococcus lugosii]
MKKIKIIISLIVVSLIINITFIVGYHLFTQNYLLENKLVDENIQNIDTLSGVDNVNDLQDILINTISNSGKGVVSIIISRDLDIYYQDPLNFFGGYSQQENQEIGGGSGIIVSKDGYIITNKHVIQEARRGNTNYTVVTKDGFRYDVDKIWFDPILDIAVLKILNDEGNVPSNLNTVNLVSVFDNIKVGQFVLAIGNALSQFQDSASFGIISGKGRQLEDIKADSIYVGLYQTDAPINPGNSGGPLMDIWGNVLGINTAISAIGQGIGFSIPINEEFVESTLEMVINDNEITRPFLGVEHTDINNAIAIENELSVKNGVLISNVVPNSSADNAGIKSGDIITHINGNLIGKGNTFLYQLFAYKPGDNIQFRVISDGNEKNVDVELGVR